MTRRAACAIPLLALSACFSSVNTTPLGSDLPPKHTSGGSSGSTGSSQQGNTGGSTSGSSGGNGSTGGGSTTVAGSSSNGGSTTGGTPSGSSSSGGSTGAAPSATVISGSTTPDHGAPLLAYNGSVTMAVWTDYGLQGAAPVAVWATVQNGAVAAQGIVGPYVTGPLGTLVAVGSQFLLSAGHLGGGAAGLVNLLFDGQSWSTLQSGPFAVSGQSAMIVNSSTLTTQAWLVGASGASSLGTVSQHPLGVIAGDGQGGFGLITVDETINQSQATLHFTAYSKGSWSGDSVVTTVTPPTGSLIYNGLALAYDGSEWCVAYDVNQGPTSGGIVTAWVGSGGSWTSHSFATGASALALGAQSGGFAVGAVGSTAAWASVYQGGTWTDSSLSSGSGYLASVLAPLQQGYLFLYGSDVGYWGAVYSAGSWTVTSIGGEDSAGLVATVGTTTAIPLGSSIVLCANGAFASPIALPTDGVAVTAAGTGFQGLYADTQANDAMDLVSLSAAGTLGPPATLVGPAVTGGVQGFSFARASNGNALAAWLQFDSGRFNLYGAGYSGGQWGAPALIANDAFGTAAPQVVAAGTTLAVAWRGSNTGYWVAPWTNGAPGTPLNLESGGLSNDDKYLVASDGTTLVAVWDTGPSGAIVPFASTSTDGVHWTTPAAVETSGNWTLGTLSGGPAGVVLVELPYNAKGATARIWQAGAWSSGGAFASVSFETQYCQAASGATTALAVCQPFNGPFDAQFFSGGSWTHVPLNATAGYPFVLATDGSTFRLTFPGFGEGSAFFSAGAWSAAQSDVSVPQFPAGLASSNGSWLLLSTDAEGDVLFQEAVGQNPFDSPVTLQTPGTGAGLYQSGSSVDALWAAPDSTSNGVPVLWADVGL